MNESRTDMRIRVQNARLEAMQRRDRLAAWTEMHHKPHYVLHVCDRPPVAPLPYVRFTWWRVEYEQGMFTGWHRSPALAFGRMSKYVT